MHAAYDDILDIARMAGWKPVWFDENGTPRFNAHHPKHAPDIYAREVALLEIGCQECQREFLVQLSSGPRDRMHAFLRGRKLVTLADKVRDGTLHYGDPPRHGDEVDRCAAGDTMNCIDLRVVEFWVYEREWRRVPELERAIAQQQEGAPP